MNSSANTSGYAFGTDLGSHIPSFVFPIGLLYTSKPSSGQSAFTFWIQEQAPKTGPCNLYNRFSDTKRIDNPQLFFSKILKKKITSSLGPKGFSLFYRHKYFLSTWRNQKYLLVTDGLGDKHIFEFILDYEYYHPIIICCISPNCYLL